MASWSGGLCSRELLLSLGKVYKLLGRPPEIRADSAAPGKHAGVSQKTTDRPYVFTPGSGEICQETEQGLKSEIQTFKRKRGSLRGGLRSLEGLGRIKREG